MISFFRFNATQPLGSNIFDDEKTKSKYSHEKLCFGRTVHWLEGRHYSSENLEQYRFLGDVEMDRILDSEYGRRANVVEISSDIYYGFHDKLDGKKSLSDDQLALYNFYRHYHDFVPEWVDWEQIQRGIDVFITYSPAAGQALYYLSLVPGFSIPKIAKVLEKTKYLVPPSTAEKVATRLMDTGGFVSNAMLPGKNGLSAEQLRPGGKAWKMALQVRTLHAKVRQWILQNKRFSWNTNELGVPINQEDMAATLLAFSVNVLAGIHFVSGQELPLTSQRDYLALWRYIGWLLGIESKENTCDLQSFKNKIRSNLEPLDPCGTRVDDHERDDTIVHARASLESFVMHLMHPDEYSKVTAHHLLSVGRAKSPEASKSNQNAGNSLAFLYRSFMCRRFIGEPLADALGLAKADGSVKSIFAYFLSSVILIAIRIYTLLTMKSKTFQRLAYARHLKLIQRFDEVWSASSKNRLQKRSENEGGKEKPSSCPFSLAMPPLPEKETSKKNI